MLLFLDGMAHYDSSRIGTKYSAVTPSGDSTWSITAEGRFGNCLKKTTSFNTGGGYVSIAPLMTRLAPWTPTVSGVCGFAIKVADLTTLRADNFTNDITGGVGGLVCIKEGAHYHVALKLNADGTFTLARNGGGNIMNSSEGLRSATWMFVECKWVISTTTGSFEVRVNGVPVLTFSGRTQDSYTGFTLGTWNGVFLGASPVFPGPGAVLRFCDIYLADLASSLANDVHDFLGDGTILTIMPNAPGAAAGWTPSTGANWDAVNDRPAPDDDSTYVSATTVGTQDLYNFEDIPANSTVKGAQVSYMARKETEGAVSVAPLLQPPSSGLITGPAQGVANTVFDRYIRQPWDLNPTSGVRFTVNDINNGQFGIVKTI